jgi:hypothetical protein
VSTPVAGSGKTCFVAMPITTPATYVEKLGDPEHFAHVLAHLFTPALEAAGLTVIPPSVAGAEMIHAEIIRNLEQADYMLCDLSDLNPNVHFELGVRTSLDRPVMMVRDNLTARIPFDLNAINTATYDSSLKPWTLATEIPRLTDFIKKAIGSGNPGNAMWTYFGLTKRGEPSDAGANPVEAKLDLILTELGQNRQASGRQKLTANVSAGQGVKYTIEGRLDLSISESRFRDLLDDALVRLGVKAGYELDFTQTTKDAYVRIGLQWSETLPKEKIENLAITLAHSGIAHVVMTETFS